MKAVLLCLSFCFLLTSCATASTLASNDNQQLIVWTQGADIQAFWAKYAASKGGLTWGKTDTYPPYEQVKEGDTLLIQLEQGDCLMEFYHSRWRRANDVWRWSETMNSFGGCPYVFD